MNLTTTEMTTEAAELIERAIQHHAGTTALVDDIKAFSLRCADGIPDDLSVAAQDELYERTRSALAVDELYGVLDAIVSAIVTHHDIGAPSLSDEAVADRLALAHLAATTLADSMAGQMLALMPAS